jgi:hypothetical protein
VNWYGNTNVSEEGSSILKILGARLNVLKEVKIKVVFWIIAVALSLVSTRELLISMLKYFTHCKS